MSTTAGVGTVHVHPRSGSLSHNLWMMSLTMAGMPGLLREVAVHQDAEVQPLAERVVDHVCLGFMGMLAMGAAPLWGAVAGVVWAGEKLIEKLDALHGMAVRVEKFGRSLAEQEAIIEEFGPLLDLSDRVADLNAKVVKKTEDLQQSTRELDALGANYKPHADLLVRVGDMISRLEPELPKRISSEKITGLKEGTLTLRVTILRQIEEEERQMRLLAARLQGLIERVGQKAEQLQQIEAQATQLTQDKGVQIAALQTNVESLNTDPMEVTHVDAVSVMA